MSNEPADLDGTDGEQIDERTARLIGAGSGVINGVALAAACYFVFDTDALVFGAVVGLLSAIGSALLLPWILQQNNTSERSGETADFDGTVAEGRDEGAGGLDTAALGAGLEAGAVGMFAARVALDDFILAVGAGVAVALGVFLLASVLFGFAE
ncbi:MAG: hypothetical protein ACI8TL_001144 [Natronomonas sp.]|jgi:hypothetical protein